MPRKAEEEDIEFATSTSLHGVQHLVTQRPLVYKIGWSLLIIGVITLCVWQVTDRVQAYFSYQTAKEFNEITTDKIIFPTVTFCSSYRSRKDLLTENDKTVLYLNAPHYKIWENFEIATDEDISYFKTNYWTNYKNTTSSLYPKGFNFTDILLRNAYKLTNETLIVCQFNWKYCTAKDFFFLFTLKFELCWSFNSHLNVKSPRTQNKPGPDYGLISIIDLQRHKHTTAFQDSILSKFNLYLSPFGEVPLGFNDEIPVAPGVVTHIKLDYSKNIQLPYPYGNCSQNKNLPPYGTNTLQNCFARCSIEYYKKHAGCQPFIYSGFYFNPGNYCDFKDMFLADLGQENTYAEIPGKNCSFCASSCIERNYAGTIYYTEPMDSAGIKNLKKTRNVTEDYIRHNYLILRISFQNFVFHVTEEKAVMTLSSLLSDIGGALGLFMGMSIVTIVEIIAYLARRCKLTLKSIRGYIQGGNVEESKGNIELKEENL